MNRSIALKSRNDPYSKTERRERRGQQFSESRNAGWQLAEAY
jgi:hypothetical protein